MPATMPVMNAEPSFPPAPRRRRRWPVVVGAAAGALVVLAAVGLLALDSLLTSRARREAARTRQALGRVEKVAGSEENLMPAILEAVEAYATVGEIADVLRRAFGEYEETVVI